MRLGGWRVSLGLLALVLPAAASAWTPVPVADDPLVRMPGTQPTDGVVIEAPRRCMNCHDDYDRTVDPGFHWRGSMMSQAARDPLYWAAFTVAAQDSIWALGRPNATDMCLRCHTPAGWLGGRSDPPNASALVGADYDGVDCDSCHRTYDPFFEDTFAGTREGADWTGYWDEAGVGSPTSGTAAAATRAADRVEAATSRFFNGSAFYDASFQPVPTTWTENGGGQYFISGDAAKRASFADAAARHSMEYSRHHKSRYFCQTCHDVSNAALANLPFASTTPGTGTTVLPSESEPAYSYFHVERTFSEFLLSDYGTGVGAAGSGPFAPTVFTTSRAGNLIATCQDCHMPDQSGFGCDKAGAIDRPTGSTEHPQSGQPLHDLTGGNYWIPWILASTVPGSSNYDATNETLLDRPAMLTMDLTAGEGPDPDALLAGALRSQANLTRAAAFQNVSYDSGSGLVSFRIRNQTGHKLPSGYPEGRRMWVNVRVYTAGVLSFEVNPYSASADTLVGLAPAYSPSSPPAGPSERHDEVLVYEAQTSSSLTAEAHTFHFALADARNKDNRIPPRGFRIAEAAARLSEPVVAGTSSPGLFSAAEYAGGYDDVSVVVPTGADGVEVSLYYQTTSREYVEFLRDEINGTGGTLASPTPSGEVDAYIAGADPFFSALRAWGDTIWQLWDHNKAVPGAAPILMAQASAGTIGDPCAGAGSDGSPCNDGSACTTSDSCSGGVCVGASPVVCAAIDRCHRAGVCDPATGLCSNPNRPDGTTCDDGDACTMVDACTSGACVGGAAVTCTASDQCHVAGACDPATGVCSDPSSPDGSSCDDGDACTTVDSCQSGACMGGSPTTCVPLDECHLAGTCDPVTGACSNPLAPDGTVCAMGACSGGSCVGIDSGVPDAGLPDSSVSDASSPDTGVMDSGMSAVDGATPADASEDGAPSDATPDAPVDGAPLEAATGDDLYPEEGGCQCRTSGTSSGAGPPLFALLLLWFNRTRGRRRGRCQRGSARRS